MLSPARGTPIDGCTYLNLTNLQQVRVAGRKLREAVQDTSSGGVHEAPVLAICHRYRAYRVLRASGLKVPRTITVAHEFGFFRRFQRRLEQRLFARGVVFAGVSPAVQAELAETVLDPMCLPNALDLNAVREESLSRTDALDRLNVPESQALTIGLVGRLVDKKSPELAIEAVRRLSAQEDAVRLLVLGDGPLRGELEQRAEGLPVTFLGFVPDAKRLFRAMDLLLLTSQEVEAFGMVALEAMAVGIPVVAGLRQGRNTCLAAQAFTTTSGSRT